MAQEHKMGSGQRVYNENDYNTIVSTRVTNIIYPKQRSALFVCFALALLWLGLVWEKCVL